MCSGKYHHHTLIGQIYLPASSQVKTLLHKANTQPDLLEALKAYRSMVGNTGYAIDRGQAKILYDKATILIEKSKGGDK